MSRFLPFRQARCPSRHFHTVSHNLLYLDNQWFSSVGNLLSVFIGSFEGRVLSILKARFLIIDVRYFYSIHRFSHSVIYVLNLITDNSCVPDVPGRIMWGARYMSAAIWNPLSFFFLARLLNFHECNGASLQRSCCIRLRTARFFELITRANCTRWNSYK